MVLIIIARSAADRAATCPGIHVPPAKIAPRAVPSPPDRRPARALLHTRHGSRDRRHPRPRRATPGPRPGHRGGRKSVVEGKRVAISGDLGGRRSIEKKSRKKKTKMERK